MPLYEYQCQGCGRRYQRIERASALHDGVCPECGGAAHRLVSAPALQFKGSGWYVTDYGTGNGGPAASGDGAPAPSTSADGAPSKDSETAPSSAAKAPSTSDSKVA